MNGFWQNQSFHNYADYALSDEFARGLEQLLRARDRAADRDHVRRGGVVALPPPDHRRLCCCVRGRAVFHLMGNGRAEPAKLTAGGRSEETAGSSIPRRTSHRQG